MSKLGEFVRAYPRLVIYAAVATAAAYFGAVQLMGALRGGEKGKKR